MENQKKDDKTAARYAELLNLAENVTRIDQEGGGIDMAGITTTEIVTLGGPCTISIKSLSTTTVHKLSFHSPHGWCPLDNWNEYHDAEFDLWFLKNPSNDFLVIEEEKKEGCENEKGATRNSQKEKNIDDFMEKESLKVSRDESSWMSTHDYG